MVSPKIVVVMASPRKRGNSTLLARQAIAGAEAAGAQVDRFFLHEMNIQPCAACDACCDAVDTDCIIDDDMRDLYPKLRQADALIIASPIYWFTMAAQAKLFMDRCYALGGPDGHGLKGKRIGIILTYGDVDPFVSGAVNALRAFQDAFNYIGAEIVGMVYGSAEGPGEIEKNRELMQQAYQLGERLGAAK